MLTTIKTYVNRVVNNLFDKSFFYLIKPIINVFYVLESPMVSNPILSAALASKKSQLRKRALFYHFGGLVLSGSSDESISIARLAISEAYELDNLPDVATTRDVILSCQALRSGWVYDDEHSELFAINKDVIRDCYIPNLLQLQPTWDGKICISARTPVGEIVADGINLTVDGMIRTCPWCQQLFAPIRSSGYFCRDACRSAHRNKEDREN